MQQNRQFWRPLGQDEQKPYYSGKQKRHLVGRQERVKSSQGKD